MAAKKVYEVMVDTYGHAPTFVKGDLINADEFPYDLKHALAYGIVREAPEYRNADIESATQPLTAEGKVDEGVQEGALAGAEEPQNLPPEEREGREAAQGLAAAQEHEARVGSQREGRAAGEEREGRGPGRPRGEHSP